MATKKSTKQSKGDDNINICVLHFNQFALEELMATEGNLFDINIEGQCTYLTPEDFTRSKLKNYDIVGPKMNVFIRQFNAGIKADFEKNKFESKYVKFLQLLKDKQQNLYLFELYKTSNIQKIRSISTIIKGVSDNLIPNAADPSDDYGKLAELMCVSLSILVFNASFVIGSQIKDAQGFKRLFANLYSNGYFKLDGANHDRDFINIMLGLVTKTFETQAKGKSKAGAAKAQQTQELDKRTEESNEQVVDDILNGMN